MSAAALLCLLWCSLVGGPPRQAFAALVAQLPDAGKRTPCHLRSPALERSHSDERPDKEWGLLLSYHCALTYTQRLQRYLRARGSEAFGGVPPKRGIVYSGGGVCGAPCGGGGRRCRGAPLCIL